MARRPIDMTIVCWVAGMAILIGVAVIAYGLGHAVGNVQGSEWQRHRPISWLPNLPR